MHYYRRRPLPKVRRTTEALGTLEHKVFEQMGQPRVLIILVLGTHAIEDIHMNHFGALVEYMHQTQTIIE